MLFSEKNIPNLIILTPIFTIIILTSLITFFFVDSQYKYFKEQSVTLEKNYIQKQRTLLKNEVNRVINYIAFHKKNLKNLSDKELKKTIAAYIETIRYGDNGYIWVHDTNYYLVAHPFRKDMIGKYDINLKDESGAFITRAFINIAISKPEGGFLEYYWKKPSNGKVEKKLGFLKLYAPWKWVIGSGLYMDDISHSIKIEKKHLEEKINKQIQVIMLIAFTFMFLVGMISFVISRNIINALNSYKEKVRDNELTLKTKIAEAISESQKKDQALLYQSRLAQMGEMISMIAHQWKQPLSEVSGIFMELETIGKFDELDKNYVLECAKDGDKITEYMSRTIEDFRNFFKPDKKRERFDIQTALDETLTLVDASIKNSHIQIISDISEHIYIEGYPNEYSQVILNILMNARDALISRNIANPEIHIKVYQKKDQAILEIIDNAGGIDEEILDKIFDPYFSTKDNVNGTGLGLYMSKMIIEKSMNGRLSVQNTDSGASFKIEVKICN
ncbi:MAG: cache domain-containing protein [Sulfurospirillaceae bacterium]|nr:cache domain-containing protein [Sulfurospirillaceae bacterium]